LGLTQRRLAELSGVDKSSVSKWESGANAPRWRTEPAVAAALDWTVRELRGEAAA
jgi:transcriptional regulator with XRE-family HTH domain